MEQRKDDRKIQSNIRQNVSPLYRASGFSRTILALILTIFLLTTFAKCDSLSLANSVKTENPSKNTQTVNRNIQSSLPDLDSGAYFLQNDNSNKRYHCFIITLRFKPPASGYEVAISLRNIENYQPVNGLDFAIRYSKQPTAVQGVFQIDKYAKWTKIHFWYVFTARIDLRVGSFIAETSQLLSCAQTSKQVQVTHHLKNHWKGIKSKDYVVLVAFLTGIKTQDSQLGVYIADQKFSIEQNIITLKIKTANSDSPLESLYICYFIFELGYQYQLSNLLNTQILPQQTDGQNVFIGIRGVSAQKQDKLLKNTMGLLNTQIPGTQVLQRIGEFKNMFDVKGLVIKNQFLFPIMSPKDNQRDFSSVNVTKNGQKVSSLIDQNRRIVAQYVTIGQCKQRGGFIKTSIKENGDFIDQCKICDKNSSFNISKKDCQCLNGFIADSLGTCTLKSCPQGQTFKNGTCQKNQPNQKEKQKNISCSIDQQYRQGACICKQQFFRINNNECVKKESCIQSNGLVFNQSNKKCQCINEKQFYNSNQIKCNRCKRFKQWHEQKNQCNCVEGAHKIYKSQQCIKCDLHAYFNGKGCICFPGYIGDGFTCKKLKSTTILLSSAGVRLEMQKE